MNQHKKDVEYQRANNATAKYTYTRNQPQNQLARRRMLRKGKKNIPRKILESHYINKFKYNIMDMT